MRGSINGGTPIARWFIREDPVKIDDLGVPPFMETPISYGDHGGVCCNIVHLVGLQWTKDLADLEHMDVTSLNP